VMSLFSLGQVETSPAAAAALVAAGRDLEGLLARHQRGDWGDVDQRLRQYNDWASQHEAILWSTYRLSDEVALLVSTAADRSSTHVLLESEFQRQEVSTQDGYALWAETYDQEKNPLVAVEEPIVDRMLTELNVTTALDVGTGTGRYALKLARRGVAVSAVDQSAEMLAVAQQADRAEGLSIDLRLASVEGGLPFKAERYDLVVCALMLCHVPDLAQAAREFARVLRAGGYLLITDFHPDSVAMGWRTLVSRPEGTYYLPNVSHTRADYLEALERAGFTLRQVLDLPVRDVPQGYLPDTLTRQEYDAALCLIILAQKRALR
jgi:ubiquinone/menaquinone biosynthesis C-methylase UbiE